MAVAIGGATWPVWLVLAWAGPPPELTRFEFRQTHMGSEFKLLLYTGDAATARRASDAAFAALREHLSELAVLELTYIATWYDLHAVMSKALRLELDDVDDRMTEVTGPGITRSLRPDAEPE